MPGLALRSATSSHSMSAPDTRRIIVKLAASMAVRSSARRHRMELAANAVSATSVSNTTRERVIRSGDLRSIRTVGADGVEARQAAAYMQVALRIDNFQFKKTLHASEQERADVQQARRE